MTRLRVVIIRRRAVLDAEEAITAMIERLNGAEPVRPEGMALAERILTNGERSPLYNAAHPGALARVVHAATSAMDSGAPQSHEFAIGA
jgi:hypothetical protein